MKTYELRVIQKAVNTTALARLLAMHPGINVSCPVLEDSPNHASFRQHMRLGLPAGLFTIDVEGKEGRPGVPRAAYKQAFDLMEPAIGMQVSLGQTNTVALCPALTTHSEMDDAALAEAGIAPTTTRISVGLEDPRQFLVHFIQAARLAIDPVCPGFSGAFPDAETIDRVYRETYLDIHTRHIDALPDANALHA